MFSCEIGEIFKNIHFEEHLRTAAFAFTWIRQAVDKNSFWVKEEQVFAFPLPFLEAVNALRKKAKSVVEAAVAKPTKLIFRRYFQGREAGLKRFQKIFVEGRSGF